MTVGYLLGEVGGLKEGGVEGCGVGEDFGNVFGCVLGEGEGFADLGVGLE